jgi:VanZ family protein
MKPSKLISFFQYQLPVLAWMLFIFSMSSIPGTKINLYFTYADKVVHFGVFLILCWLTHIAFRFHSNIFLIRYSLFLAFSITVLYGLSDEIHQMFTPNRSSDVMDLLSDAFGSLIYVVFYSKFKIYEKMNATPTSL